MPPEGMPEVPAVSCLPERVAGAMARRHSTYVYCSWIPPPPWSWRSSERLRFRIAAVLRVRAALHGGVRGNGGDQKAKRPLVQKNPPLNLPRACRTKFLGSANQWD